MGKIRSKIKLRLPLTAKEVAMFMLYATDEELVEFERYYERCGRI